MRQVPGDEGTLDVHPTTHYIPLCKVPMPPTVHHWVAEDMDFRDCQSEAIASGGGSISVWYILDLPITVTSSVKFDPLWRQLVKDAPWQLEADALQQQRRAEWYL